jgi:transcriptional regulator with XRE-family HTH domain
MVKSPFDYKAWRARMGWTTEECAQALGCSREHYWKLEREGAGSKTYAWAAYGHETYNKATEGD